MKLKLILISAFSLSLISIQASAYEGQGFKIISEKTTHSPGFIASGLKENLKKKTVLRYINARVATYDTRGHINEYIKVQADHTISISNYMSRSQRYTYKYILSCESAFYTFERTVEIYPHGYYSDSSHSYGVVQKEEPGTYRINAATQISGAENSFDDDHAALTVSR